MKSWVIDNQQCKVKVAECSTIIKEEIERWLGRSLGAHELSLMQTPANWKRVYQHTYDGKTIKRYECSVGSNLLSGMVVSRHSGYSVSITVEK